MMLGAKDKQKEDTTAIAEALEVQAVEAEIEALDKADELFASYEAEHRAQSEGYVFDCRRWGDFLTIYVERKVNNIKTTRLSKIAASLNIGAVKRIRIEEGHAPDRKHQLSYQFDIVRDKGADNMWLSGYQCLRSGVNYKVYPNFPHLPTWRPILVEVKKPDNIYGNITYCNNHHILHKTDGFPRPAEDDILYFDGIGQSLYIPAEMGKEIHDRIMSEIERGWDRPKLASSTEYGRY